MKAYYDADAFVRDDISVGCMVLVRTPALSSKFNDAWAGPYEVLHKVTWETLVQVVCLQCILV